MIRLRYDAWVGPPQHVDSDNGVWTRHRCCANVNYKMQVTGETLAYDLAGAGVCG